MWTAPISEASELCKSDTPNDPDCRFLPARVLVLFWSFLVFLLTGPVGDPLMCIESTP